jgi:3-demethoxyubiquinol 3-hydroxylase
VQNRRMNVNDPHHISSLPARTVVASPIERLIAATDEALRAVYGFQTAKSAHPAAAQMQNQELTPAEKRHAAALMRVNHVGEVCAQALYNAQAAATLNPALQQHFKQAAIEEGDHLAWTRERVQALGSHTSWLNPLWYGGAYALGRLAGRFGDATSLGFVVETERQVEAHLDSHLSSLPDQDLISRAIVAKMKSDEADHAQQALDKGARDLPQPVKSLMTAAAKVMTTVAYHI